MGPPKDRGEPAVEFGMVVLGDLFFEGGNDKVEDKAGERTGGDTGR